MRRGLLANGMQIFWANHIGLGRRKSLVSCPAVPHEVKLVDGGFNKRWVISQHPYLKVAFVLGLHADTRARKICRTDINDLQVKDYHLEMHTGTEHPFQPFDKNRIFVKILTEIASLFLGVEESHLLDSHTVVSLLIYKNITNIPDVRE